MDDDIAILESVNRYILTEDNTPILQESLFYSSVLRNSLLMHNQSYANVAVQAYIGRYFIQSGERVIVSLANKRLRKKDMYSEVRHTLLEMMLTVAIVTLAYVLLLLKR